MHYTTSITKIGPYIDLAKVKFNYLIDYEDVILSLTNPVSRLPEDGNHKDGFQIRARAHL